MAYGLCIVYNVNHLEGQEGHGEGRDWMYSALGVCLQKARRGRQRGGRNVCLRWEWVGFWPGEHQPWVCFVSFLRTALKKIKD